MRKIINIFGIIFIFALVSCSTSNSATVKVDFAKTLGLNTSRSISAGGTVLQPTSVKSIVLTVFAGDVIITDDTLQGKLLFQATYSSDSSSADMDVPAGENRTVVLEAKDGNGNTLYRGISDPVTLEADKTVTVTITVTKVKSTIAGSTITINLVNSDGTTTFNHFADLLGDTLNLSVFAASSENVSGEITDVANVDATALETKKIKAGITNTSFTVTIPDTVTADYLMAVFWGENKNLVLGFVAGTFVRYIGVAVIIDNLVPTTMNVKMINSIGDWDNDSGTPDIIHPWCANDPTP